MDYILAPVQPEVLRTKVGVFVELYRKTAQTRHQATALEQRTLRLQKLTRASFGINSARSVEGILRAAADFARDLLEAQQAIATSLPEGGGEPFSVASLSAEFEPGGERAVVRDPAALARTPPAQPPRAAPSRGRGDGRSGMGGHPRPPAAARRLDRGTARQR